MQGGISRPQWNTLVGHALGQYQIVELICKGGDGHCLEGLAARSAALRGPQGGGWLSLHRDGVYRGGLTEGAHLL